MGLGEFVVDVVELKANFVDCRNEGFGGMAKPALRSEVV